MAYVGLIMFLAGLWGLKSEYFGNKWRGERRGVEPEDEVESRLHVGMIKSWGALVGGVLLMLLYPWDCSGL